MTHLEQKLDQFEELTLSVMCQTNKWGSSPFSKQQYLLLLTLHNQGTTTVSSLAEELNLSPSATTLAINRLVRDGHIVRTRDKTDRRMVWLELTESAKMILQEMRMRRRDLMKIMLSSLEPEETELFMVLANKMLNNLKNKA